MRLSDAIALGSTILPPRECPFWLRKVENLTSGCALEMALAAAGRGDLDWTLAECVWPWLAKKSDESSCVFWKKSYLTLVYEKFDSHVVGGRKDWTLDQLIDWVRLVEPPELEETANGDRAETSAATNPVCS